ncbi:cbb3-type cytochrome oxidase assembly protein CcoS [Bacteroidota bacterium]
MSVIILLIIFSIIIATGFLVAFIWAVKTGQFDDTSSPSVRMLFDDQKQGRRRNKNAKAETAEKDK